VRRLRTALLLTSLSALFLLTLLPVNTHVEALDPGILHGRVFDGSTWRPIVNATVQVWDITRESISSWRLVTVGQTDLEGYYSITLGETFRSRVYAYYDDPRSPGFDYVPAFQDTYLSGEMNLTFVLKPGASLVVEGEFRFVETSQPTDLFTFTVIDPSTGFRLDEDCVYDYGSKNVVHDFLGLGSKHIVVPADTPVDVLVNASILVNNRRVNREFRLSGMTPFVLGKSQENRVSMEPSLSGLNFASVESGVESVERSLDEVEQKGFYVTLEKQDLVRVKELVNTAARELADDAYDEVHADLREAYLGSLEINRRIDEIYVNASSSTAILTFFLALTAMVLSSILFERLLLNVLGAFGFFGSFFTILYFIYPGVRLVQISSFLMNMGFCSGIVFLAYFLSSRIVNERLISIF